MSRPIPITAPTLQPFRHGFFGRIGGVSSGLYGSLNCGLGSSDTRSLVLENRARVAAAIGLEGRGVMTCHQIHSAAVLIVDRPFAAGEHPKADALVTNTPGLVLGALAADCMPLLFADAEAGVVAAAHAGWKGALHGVAEAALEAMTRLGARRSRIHAVIGPCISGTSYEVGAEFQEAFLAHDPSGAPFFATPTAGGRPHLDLPAYMLARLSRAGVASATNLDLCTYQNADRFFSYRRTTHRNEPDYGRQVAVIAADRV